MDALFDDLLNDYKINAKDHKWACRVVGKHLRPHFGKLPPDKVTTAEIREYVATRLERGAANGTINRSLALLKRAFNLAREATPPRVGQTPFIPMLAEAPPRSGFFEHEEYVAVRDALPVDVRPILAFGYWTGCRKGEIVSLQWRQVDLLERMVRLEPGTTKNGEPRIIPLAPELYEMLAVQRQVRDQLWPKCPWVFARLGKRIKNFRKAWDTACQQVGFWEGDPDTGRLTKLFHDCRRSGVRNLVRSGAPENVAMQISGHKTRSVFDRYNIVSERDLKLAAARLGEYLAPKKDVAPVASKRERSTKFQHSPKTDGVQ